ncbi:YbjN domain-containing protein [Candidatus Oscillochloris fontis]|uniref:YbjN domain-containing protein n=1 Tax=Candidatus Oscillochloris fontis TaxID=2496868 RepID=UPI00101BDEF6|nr:YbjN domain-containing protein [Candidatus Oscillochloris fontis]
MTENSSNPTDDVVYPEQINSEFLLALFQNAYLNVSRDDDGDIFIKENFTTWIFPQGNGEQLRFMAQFKANLDLPRIAKLEYANLVNDRMKLLRAYVDADDDIGFDYHVLVEGGITKRNIVFGLRTFINYIQVALQRDTENVIN